MCGRYTLKNNAQAIVKAMRARPMSIAPSLFGRFNVAPGQPLPVVRLDERGRRELVVMKWGLVPFWADDPKIGNRMVNARAEKVTTSGAYKAAMKYRRCLLPADGFYEWKAPASGKGPKQPYHFAMEDGSLFAFAGLWEHWQDAQGNELETTTIITTESNPLVAEVHDRMPVILAAQEYDRWLTRPSEDAGSLVELLDAYPVERMTAWPVGREVNKSQHEGAALAEPMES